MKNENNCCDECQQDFDRNIDRIVDQVDGYSEKDRLDKRSEVEKAFEGREGCAGREGGREDGREGGREGANVSANAGRECYGRGEHNELDRRHEQQGYTEQREAGAKNEWDEQRERREQPAEHQH